MLTNVKSIPQLRESVPSDTRGGGRRHQQEDGEKQHVVSGHFTKYFENFVNILMLNIEH